MWMRHRFEFWAEGPRAWRLSWPRRWMNGFSLFSSSEPSLLILRSWTQRIMSLPWIGLSPGILQHFDIPDIAAAIYPRPVWVINAVDAEWGRLAGIRGTGALLEEDTRGIDGPRSDPHPCDHRRTIRRVYVDWLKQS